MTNSNRVVCTAVAIMGMIVGIVGWGKAMSDRRSGGFFGGLVVGAAIGAVTGLLVAPRTGRETRHILKKSAAALPELVEDLSTSLYLQADRLSETTLANWEHTLTRLQAAIAAGQAASRREYEHLTQTSAPVSSHDPEQT